MILWDQPMKIGFKPRIEPGYYYINQHEPVIGKRSTSTSAEYRRKHRKAARQSRKRNWRR